MSNKKIIPVIPVFGVTVLPDTNLVLNIENERALQAVGHVVEFDTEVLLVTQKTEKENKFCDNVLTYGTVCTIRSKLKLPDKAVRVFLEGHMRARIVRYVSFSPYLTAEIEELEYIHSETDKSLAGFRYLRKLLNEYLEYKRDLSAELKKAYRHAEGMELLNKVAELLSSVDKKDLICEEDVEKMLMTVCKALKEETSIARYENEFESSIEKRMRSMERDAILRAKIRSLEEELGEAEDDDDELQAQIDELDAPKEIKEKLNKEMKRMRKMVPSSGEVSLIRSYLEYCLELPWNKKSEDNYDLVHAKTILDEDHFGLGEVKDRILEYLAVKKLSDGAGKGSIMCFIGPPGVGKTSVAQSVARALGKRYAHMSLGGVKDESEIRGHRKTYLGAMPGRILTCIAKAGASNPLFLLDEIDKLSSDMRGDPSSAMLEVLDPAQNKNFRDNYLEMPYDLSDVLFIATANNIESIQKPLLDRMEIIEMSGYTREEKFEIAKRYLLSKQLKNCGIEPEKFSLSDAAIYQIIDLYTRESGVRELERKIGMILRKVARKFIEDASLNAVLCDVENLHEYLGRPRYRKKENNAEDEVGVATGLAWTAVGGETLKIEVSLMKGKGSLLLTGKLGDVMQESAKTAISYLRANAEKYEIDSKIFEKNDIHIHVPEGAVPKDGPSAGITIATALLSALTGKSIKSNIAMTGEITLHGNVLPVGGLKEKTLAAIRYGIHTVILPKENEADVEDIEIEDEFKFIFADQVDAVFRNAVNGL